MRVVIFKVPKSYNATAISVKSLHLLQNLNINKNILLTVHPSNQILNQSIQKSIQRRLELTRPTYLKASSGSFL